MQKKFNLGSLARSFLSGFQTKEPTDSPGTPTAVPALVQKREPKPETVQQSLVTINAMAKAQGLTPIDAKTVGNHYKGEVVAVSAHHTLVQISEYVGALHENDTLSRPMKLGERVKMDLETPRVPAASAKEIEPAEIKQAPPPPQKPERELVDLLG